MFALPPTDDRGEMLGERPGQLSTQAHYRLEGNAAHPLVVLVNGIMDPPERMESTAAAMRDAGFRTLRYDHYGRGWSRAPAGFRYDAAAHIAQLCALLKELALAPVALFAHSMGAIVASLFAEQTPSVKALVLAAPAGRMRNPLPCFRGLQLLFGVCGGCGVALVQALMGGPAPPGDWINDTGDSRVAQLAAWDAAWDRAHRRGVGNRALAASVVRMPLVSLQLGASLRERGVATLLLTAEKDPLVRGVDADFWRSAVGAAHLTVQHPVPGGHCFFIQEAARVHPTITAFLRAHAA